MLKWMCDMCRHTRRDLIKNKAKQGQGEIGISSRQNEGSKTKMVRACEQEVWGGASKQAREVVVAGGTKDRGTRKKELS